MTDIDYQEKLVRAAYVMQWGSLLIPPLIVVSLIYLLAVRRRVGHVELRSHLNWQLMTCGMIAAMIPLALLLLFIGLSGVNTDAPISIVATFTLVGASALFLPWLLYRLLRGTVQFTRQLPMKRLFP